MLDDHVDRARVFDELVDDVVPDRPRLLLWAIFQEVGTRFCGRADKVLCSNALVACIRLWCYVVLFPLRLTLFQQVLIEPLIICVNILTPF